MNKSILIILLASLYHHYNFAQKSLQVGANVPNATSLVEKEDTARVNQLNALAFEFKSNDPDTAIYFAGLALELSKKWNYKLGVANADANIGSAKMNMGDFKSALENLNNALKIYDELLNDVKFIEKPVAVKQKARVYSIIGNICLNQGNYTEALNNYFNSLKLRKEIGDQAGIASVSSNIASVYIEEGNYPEALKTHLTALKIREELGDKDAIAASYNNIGTVYEGMLNYSEALKMHFSSLKMSQEVGNKKGIATSYDNIGGIYSIQKNYEKALENLNASLKIREEIGDKRGIVTSNINIGNVYQQKSLFNDALKNYFAALKSAEEMNDVESIAFVKISIGNVYASQNKKNEASVFLNEGLGLSKEIGNLFYIKNAYAALSTLDSLKGDYVSALHNYKMFIIYRDSLYNEENTKKLVQTQMQYEFDKKQSLLKAEQENKDALSKAEINRQVIIRNSSIAGVIGLLIAGSFLFYSFRRRKKLESQEALATERLRISRELHDDIGSTLGSIAVYSDIAHNRSKKNESPAEALTKIGSTTRDLIEKMSDIVWSLNPNNETWDQLQSRMQSFAAMILTPKGITFEIKTYGDFGKLYLTNVQRKDIFLIYKEAIHNCMKYSECKNVLVSAEFTDNLFSLVVKDDGLGFDITAFKEGREVAYNGNGIKSMKARAEEMNGTFEINSGKNQGTQIKVAIKL
jgi:signal transduction histidine kinase